MSIFFLNTIVFFVPGTLFRLCLGILNVNFFWSLFLSYLFLVIHLHLFQLFDFPVELFWVLYIAEAIALTLIAVGTRIGLSKNKLNVVDSSGLGIRFFFGRASIKGLMLIAILTGIYYWWGPYTEIPADIWNHLESIRFARKTVEAGVGIPDLNVWYVIQAWLWLSSATTFDEYLRWTGVFNALVFTGGCYFASREILERVKGSAGKNLILISSTVSTVAMLLFFGMGIFSYFRYYLFAPGYFAYVLYLFILALLASFKVDRRSQKKSIATLGIAVAVGILAYVIHKQEALFILVSTVCVVVFSFVDSSFLRSRTLFIESTGGINSPLRSARDTYRCLAVFFLIGAVISVLLGAAVEFPYGAVKHRDLFDLGRVVPELSGLKLMKASSQFIQSFGLLGALVVLGTLVPRAVQSAPTVLFLPALVAVFIVFNPIVVEVFLSLGSQEVVWRFGYMAPWPILLGFLFLWAEKLSGSAQIYARLILLAPLVGCIFMFSSGLSTNWNFVNELFKSTTLQRTPSKNSHEYLSDLIYELGQNPQVPAKSHVITDPVTGYILSSSTNHSHRRQKFHAVDFVEYNLPGYSDRTFEDFQGWLLVVNRRNGQRSQTGEISGHWDSDILNFKRYYSPSFLEFVKQYTETESSDNSKKRFRELWRKDDIAIYLII